jgi:predicted DNA-binding WGR domain protein
MATITRRYEFIGGASRKFWEIDEPQEIDGQYAVNVRFGRIGGWEQSRTHIEGTGYAANRYYQDKVSEKLNKGYERKGPPKQTILKQAPAPIGMLLPKAQPAKPALPCQHSVISKKGATWECSSCKSIAEFGKSATPVTIEQPEFEKKIRRFFDLSKRSE